MPITDRSNKSLGLTWLDIREPTTEDLKKISAEYHLHEYTLRDCMQPDHLPKHEQLGHVQFVITRLLTGETKRTADSIQEMSNKLALFYDENFVITIHRTDIPFLDDLQKEYITTGHCKNVGDTVIRIIWNILNTYDKPAIELSAQVDALETKVFLHSRVTPILADLYYIKRKASVAHKLLLLTSDAVNSIRSSDRVAHQDLKDLHVKLLHMYGQIYEDVTNLLNVYISISSQRTNDVMKILTIFSAFFLPLTFIVGVYGMNFRFMPEIESPIGYPATLAGMAITALIIYIWFKRKGWL